MGDKYTREGYAETERQVHQVEQQTEARGGLLKELPMSEKTGNSAIDLINAVKEAIKYRRSEWSKTHEKLSGLEASAQVEAANLELKHEALLAEVEKALGALHTFEVDKLGMKSQGESEERHPEAVIKPEKIQ